jgi:hypothetical protein
MEDWKTRLRDLHLTSSPDEEGLHTRSITFNWGKFTFEQTNKEKVEFYLTTREAIEEFIERELELQRQATIADLEKFVEQRRVDSNRFEYEDMLEFIAKYSPSQESKKEER